MTSLQDRTKAIINDDDSEKVLTKRHARTKKLGDMMNSLITLMEHCTVLKKRTTILKNDVCG